MQHLSDQLNTIAGSFTGELYFDNSVLHQTQLMAYSTDASVYQEKPLAVALPKNVADIQLLVKVAAECGLTLIPRAAGTSLAGQVVGNGIVVDISKYFNQVIEVNPTKKWVRVQPGVIRDDLNHYLKPHGLMFGPETSTASRAMIGGMVGNNSCGLHSIVWGAVRDHLIEAKVILSDGSEAIFKTKVSLDESSENLLEHKIYRELSKLLSDKHNQELIRQRYPKSTVTRRNTGYALDSLLEMAPFADGGASFNLCSLLAGSEGTLAFVTEVKIGLLDLPPTETALICIHCNSIQDSLTANMVALKHKPLASELVDKFIMDFTINHPEYHKNRFFIEGDPAAILMVEFMEPTREAVTARCEALISDLQAAGTGYAYPILYNQDTKYGWEVRKAGLGLLRNISGEKQPVNLIEDCAVAPEDLPAYISDLQELLARHQVQASYYAHAGAGELHVEPILDLKSEEGIRLFRTILEETVELIRKYNGSLSGEHGDGRLRGEFIPSLLGEEVYDLLKQVKHIFDPKQIFNAGKITNTPKLEANLRHKVGNPPAQRKTVFDFSGNGGILKLAEKCSGSGDCRKSEITGGVMCPSYMATRREKDTTRARANVLRQFLSNEQDEQPFDHHEIKEVMDLCLSCKGCKAECPSSVDVAKMKAEFLQHYYDRNGVPFRSKLIGDFTRQMELASKLPWGFNLIYSTPFLRRMANNIVGFHPDRTIPKVSAVTLRNWDKKRTKTTTGRKVYLFCDEFTNYNDTEIGKKAVQLLEALGYQVVIPEHVESGRTWLSKGLVKKAAEIANKNISMLADVVTADAPLIGVEPSAILTFRDEYVDLAENHNLEKALKLSQNVFTIEEFLSREASRGMIDAKRFTPAHKEVVIHGHCFQKALSTQKSIADALSIPANYQTKLIPSGCCGMAGSFGYEKEHYDVSQQIGELVLFPTVRKLSNETIIAASGTSCRHQIKDGTAKLAQHPVEILWEALIK
ncbi:FAD-binding protein [Mucilaginibacter sp. RS28]|uniref:FAD-binding protein n=1 Tax=Mucilaginibacter straminoryzae TaxID=2932774 RepID=A0A9X2BCB7_9SPHI|nr:FAD-binding and (Fe-S)-binding domain-containing protein [Mucilaginibacter straminoryzae]MCJ8209148.1 FAD-binding protein [Mucilaginibacter straminoryzae]